MDISSLTNVSSNYIAQAAKEYQTSGRAGKNEFDSVLQSAMGMINETNAYQNDAESQEIKFALGEADNTNELAASQKKAMLTLQYTTAVRDKMIEAYKEIMNISI